MLQALLPHGQDLLMTAASHGALEATLADLQAEQQASDPRSAAVDPVDATGSLRSRIVLVSQALAQARVVPGETPEQAVVGTVVEVDDGRKQARYTLTVLAPAEDPAGSIAVSVTSPVGVALHGTRIGDTAVVVLPDGRRRELRVLRIAPAA
jgi:transcription elongation GreA/GreB family factor